MNDLISIITPIYNVEKYLERCIDSVLAQTYKNIELILINDGSTDRSGEIAENYLKVDSRIKVIHQKNAGVSNARNQGLSKAKGSYVMFVDADDFIASNLINVLYNISKRDNCDISVCEILTTKSLIFDESKAVIKKRTNIISNFQALELMLYQKKIINGPVAKLYKKDYIGKTKFPTKIRIGEDLLFNFNVFKKPGLISLNKSKLYFYYQREGSAMNSQFSNKRLDGLKVTNFIYKNSNFNSKIKSASTTRQFIEAVGILLKKKEINKNSRLDRKLIQILKNNSMHVILNGKAKISHRLYALIFHYFGVNILLKFIKLYRRDKYINTNKKVLLRFYNKNNLGDDLFVKILTDRYLNNFTIITTQYNSFFMKIKNLKIHSNKLIHITFKIIEKLSRKNLFYLRYLSRFNDLLVYVGGSIFMNNEKNINSWKKEQKFYDSLKVPYIIIGANVGPFIDKSFLNIVESIFTGAEDVCFREKYSYDLIKHNESIRLSTDIVFSCNINQYINKNKKRAIFSIINCKDRFSFIISHQYKILIINLITNLFSKGYEIALMSFCKFEGDEDAIYDILSDVNKEIAKKIKIFKYNGNIDEALQFISDSEIIVGTRFHSVILGLLFNKKVLPLIYSNKTSDFLTYLDYKGESIDIRNKIKFDSKNFDFDSIKIVDIDHQIKLAELQFQELDKLLTKKII